MSVIPFILGKTIVETREEYENAEGLEGNVIFIQNLDINQIKDSGASNASYDLRVGDEYRDHRDTGKTELPANGKICLQPGAAVIIETEEYVQFPKTRFGHIVPKVSLLQEGISNTSSKIDPGYFGKLLVTVFNLGKQNVYLGKGQKFCTLYVLNIEAGVLPYRKEPKRIVGNLKKSKFNAIRDKIEYNQTYLTAILIFVTILLLTIQTVQVILWFAS